MKRRVLVVLVPLICADLWTSVNGDALGAQVRSPVSVSLSSQSIFPGDVVRVDVANVGETNGVNGTFLNTQVPFDFDQERGVWTALVGIDLQTRPGTYRLRVDAGTDTTRRVTQTIRVLPKQFPIRRLRVAPDFVDPPPEVLERIADENKKTREIFAHRSPRRWQGAFLLPVDGPPVSNFGTRSYYNNRPRAPHTGVDFVSEPGMPVRASNHGAVVLAEPLFFTGNTVIVDHGAGLFSLFAHLSEYRIADNETVAPETIVGLVGATGRVTGPHLHWSVRLNGARVDPLSLVAVTQQ